MEFGNEGTAVVDGGYRLHRRRAVDGYHGSKGTAIEEGGGR